MLTIHSQTEVLELVPPVETGQRSWKARAKLYPLSYSYYSQPQTQLQTTKSMVYTSFIKPDQIPMNCRSLKVCAWKFDLKDRAFSLLTTSVFKAVDCIWKKSHTTQKTSSLLFMNFLVIPHADCYWIRLPNVSEKRGKTGLWMALTGHWEDAPEITLRKKKIINYYIKNLAHTVSSRD